MKIIIFNTQTGERVDQSRDLFVSIDGVVYENNHYGTESQSAYVTLYDFIEERPELSWKVVHMT